MIAAALATPGHAARIGVLSNKYATETAADFTSHITTHAFTAVDVSDGAVTLADLTSKFDAILLFEDGTFVNAPAVGNAVAAFAKSGRAVVLGTFYDQDRTDGSPEGPPNGWGTLETIDPNTTDGTGTPYAPRTLDAHSLVTHPLTAGVSSLTSSKFGGGNQAKTGTVVVATWTEKNAKGAADPAIAYRITGSACVIHVAIAPNYAAIGTFGTDFGGDFYRVWRNSFDFASSHCLSSAGGGSAEDAASVPTLSNAALAGTVLLLALAGLVALRRRVRR